MGKRRRGAKSEQKILLENATGEDSDHGDQREFQVSELYDDFDQFEAEEDRELIQKLSKRGKGKISDHADIGEEVLAISDSDSDLDLKDSKKKKKKKKNKKSLDEANSDMEDPVQVTYEDELVGTEGWGHKKKYFYGGNPNEKLPSKKSDGKQKNLEDDVNEMNEAEYEELESRKLQLKQVEQMDEEDFLGAFATMEKETESLKSKKSNLEEKKVSLDVSKLPSKEQRKIFMKDSPEFQGLISDFDEKMKFLQEKLCPILKALDEGKLPVSPISKYIRLKHQLYLNYCTNILCYLIFKSKRTALKYHPLAGTLVQYKKLVDQSCQIDEDVMLQIEDIVSKLNSGHKIETLIKKEKSKSSNRNSNQRLGILKQKSKALEEGNSEDENPELNEQSFTLDELKALELYEAIRNKQPDVQNIDQMEDADGDEKQYDDNDGEEGEEARRSITYQMEKNKGLIPKRSKLQRNPRVKHRVKFQKAKVRRKGQIREVRKEIKKYAGEMSGINMRVKKGIKLA